MKHNILYFLWLCFIISTFNGRAQGMNPQKLLNIITQVPDSLITSGNSFQFSYKDRPLICIYDENANRVRIISPIVERAKIGEEELLNAVVANFHCVLDVKYTLSDELIWSVFVHPLKNFQNIRSMMPFNKCTTQR